MRVLIVKTSSMGDVIHTLPAVTDAKRALPALQFDWLVEPHFAEIPLWHPGVNRVFSIPFRRWRKSPWQALKKKEWLILLKQLRETSYDAVIDAQGLLKSALLAKCAKGKRYGYNFSSVREKLASLSYHQRINVAKGQHAVERVRQLFSQIFHYPLSQTPPQYGIDTQRLTKLSYGENVLIFLHGTTWSTKHWPETYWQELGYLAASAGYQVLLPWGNESERNRAENIRHYSESKGLAILPRVLPKLTLGELSSLISTAKGIVSVDTGLGHIAAAMAVPTLSLYGPTDPKLTGAYGPSQHHLKVDFSCSPCFGRECKKGNNFKITPPCFESLPPKNIWQELMKIVE